MCRTKTKNKQNIYNSVPTAILCDGGGNKNPIQ